MGEGDVRRRSKKQKETIEEAARNMRYRFLGNAAMGAGAGVVAVGHTMDDRAETVLMHIIRGSGLDGLAAMPPRSGWPFGRGPDLARPLLELRRSDTVRYCRDCGVEARQDPTNDVLEATRNRVRHELIPILRGFNPRIDEALSRLAGASVRDSAFLDEQTALLWPSVARHAATGVELDADRLAEVHPALAVRLVRRAAAEGSGGRAEPTADQVDRLLSRAGRPGVIELSGGVRATVRRGLIVFTGGAVSPGRDGGRAPARRPPLLSSGNESHEPSLEGP
jgi:tRNA(Ile)-lysidine synthase